MSAKPAPDITGTPFGILTVTGRAPTKRVGGRYIAMWACKCACGRTSEHKGHELRRGHVKSCGCKGVLRAKA